MVTRPLNRQGIRKAVVSPLTTCITFGKPFPSFKPHFPHLQNDGTGLDNFYGALCSNTILWFNEIM